MFIAFLGLQKAGLIVANPATFVSLGEFTPSTLLAVGGIVIGGVLVVRKVKGALFYAIGGHVIKYSFGDYPDTGRLFFSIDASFSGAGLFQARFSFFVVPEYVDCDFLARVHGYF